MYVCTCVCVCVCVCVYLYIYIHTQFINVATGNSNHISIAPKQTNRNEKSLVLQYVIMCSLVERHQHFTGVFCLYLQGSTIPWRMPSASAPLWHQISQEKGGGHKRTGILSKLLVLQETGLYFHNTPVKFIQKYKCKLHLDSQNGSSQLLTSLNSLFTSWTPQTLLRELEHWEQHSDSAPAQYESPLGRSLHHPTVYKTGLTQYSSTVWYYFTYRDYAASHEISKNQTCKNSWTVLDIMKKNKHSILLHSRENCKTCRKKNWT